MAICSEVGFDRRLFALGFEIWLILAVRYATNMPSIEFLQIRGNSCPALPDAVAVRNSPSEVIAKIQIPRLSEGGQLALN